MANHKSAVKRIRQTKTRNAKNRLQHKTSKKRNKSLKETTNKKAADKLFADVTSLC